MSLIQTFPDGGGGSVIDGSTITPTDDVQIWLQCAGLHQNYTTINEVLADSGVLSALMANTNAVDYLVRSTTWATNICSNETAMNCIGVNDYCADILLADSTWRTAICNSTYFEEVLNVKVPTMTNNTTPVGECIESSHYGNYVAFVAFDDKYTVTREWLANGKTNQYVGYIFNEPVKIYKVINYNTYDTTILTRDPKDCKIEYSIDGSTWTTLKTFSNNHGSTSNVSTTNIIEPSVAAKYWRLFIVNNYGDQFIAVAELQFYGRGKSPVVDTKADISAIAPEELGSTSSRAYTVGERFYKNGKFCTCTQAIAQGATFTLNTNYVEGTIAEALYKSKFYLKNIGNSVDVAYQNYTSYFSITKGSITQGGLFIPNASGEFEVSILKEGFYIFTIGLYKSITASGASYLNIKVDGKEIAYGTLTNGTLTAFSVWLCSGAIPLVSGQKVLSSGLSVSDPTKLYLNVKYFDY